MKQEIEKLKEQLELADKNYLELKNEFDERVEQAKREGYVEATKRAIEMAVFNIPYICKFDNTPARLVGIVIPEEEKPEKHEIVQLLNPRTHRYTKVDKTDGKILSHKKSPEPYKNITIVSKENTEK